MKNEATSEIVRLYTRHETKQKNAALQKNLARHSHPFLQTAHNQQRQNITAHIFQLSERLVSKGKSIHLEPHWDNKSEIKDNAKIAEDKLYQDWNL